MNEKRVGSLMDKAIFAALLTTAAFGVATVHAGDEETLCGIDDCSVLDNYHVNCSNCHPNYPKCCYIGVEQ